MTKGYRIDLPRPDQVSTDLVREVMPRATEIVKDRAVQEAPLGKTGNLRKGIEGRTDQGGLRGIVASTARHSYIVHEGTAAHGIVTKKRALKIPAGGGVILRAAASHPGTRGQPFLTRAVEGSADELGELFRSDGESWLKKVIGR